MADETNEDPPSAQPSDEAKPESAESTVNSQVTDAIAALGAVCAGAPAVSQAMLSAMAADSVALAMLNAVARQQADGAIASAALASGCARLAGTRLPDVASPATPEQFVAAAEAQGQAAILLLKSQAGQEGETAGASRAALARLAAAAAGSAPPPPPPPARAAKASKTDGAN